MQVATVNQAVVRNIEKWPERLAVVEGDLHRTYAHLGHEIELLGRRLHDGGLRKGDRVILWLKNCSLYITAYLAVLGLGGVVVAAHPDVLVAEVLRTISQVKAVGIITTSRKWKEHGDAFQNSGPRFALTEDSDIALCSANSAGMAPNDLAQILFTSGTTGNPKGVMLSHENLVANVQSILARLNLTASDAIVAVLPFVFSYGNSVMLTHLLAGAKLIIAENLLFAHCVVEAMRKESATGFSGVASNFAFLLRESGFQSENLPSLRYLTSAGGPMPYPLLTQVRKAFPRAGFHVMYGQTEATARIAMLAPEELTAKGGSAGRAVPGVSLKILNTEGELLPAGAVGEIAVTGGNIMTGYWEDELATANKLKNGWLLTGDLGFLDEEGFLFITGRKSEMIKTAGYRISPEELEEVLLEQPDILEAGVAGVSDNQMGEIVVAGVVLKPGRKFSVNHLMAHCLNHLAPFKRPKAIYQMDRLPRSANGKILRRALGERLNSLYRMSRAESEPDLGYFA